MATGTIETTNGAIAAAKAAPQVPAISDQLGLLGALVDSGAWNRLIKMAEVFTASTIVPEHFRGNLGNCIIALQMAMRLRCDPFMLMQHLYVVHGKPGFEAKFAIALANERQVFRGPIRFEMRGEGKDRSCTAWAIDRDTGERVEESVTMTIAVAEGWTKKQGSKWLTMPDMMLKYRAAAWLIRTTCPEVLMGMQTTDEISDTNEQSVVQQTTRIAARPGQSVSERLAEQLRPQVPVDAEIVEAESKLEPTGPKGMSYDALEAAIKAAKSLKELEQLMDEISISMSSGEITGDGAAKLGGLVEIYKAPHVKK